MLYWTSEYSIIDSSPDSSCSFIEFGGDVLTILVFIFGNFFLDSLNCYSSSPLDEFYINSGDSISESD